MKLVNVKPSAYIDSSKEIYDEDPKFKYGDFVKISKYKKALSQIDLKKLCD